MMPKKPALAKAAVGTGFRKTSFSIKMPGPHRRLSGKTKGGSRGRERLQNHRAGRHKSRILGEGRKGRRGPRQQIITRSPRGRDCGARSATQERKGRGLSSQGLI